jgi:hypothetical protein
MIKVSKSSLLYKIYQFIYKVDPLSRLFTPTEYGSKDYHPKTGAFNDICTFLRTTLIYLFTIPFAFSFIIAALVLAIGTPIYAIAGWLGFIAIPAVKGISLVAYILGCIVTILYASGIIVATGVHFIRPIKKFLNFILKCLAVIFKPFQYVFQKTGIKFEEITEPVVVKTNIYKEAIVAKHDKFCKQIKLVD